MSELNSILKNQNCFFATCQDIHILVYMYMIMYQHNMDATKLHDCTLYLHRYPKNDIYNDGMIWVFPLKYLLS